MVVIGAANLDIHGAASDRLRMHDSNPGKITYSPGGVARNIAENLARLNIDCRLISALGNDPHGDLLLNHGRAAGIDMQNVLILDSQATSTYLSILDEGGEMVVAVNDMSIIDRLSADQLQPREALMKQAELIIVDANLPAKSLAYLFETHVDRPLFVDPVSVIKATKLRPHLRAVHTLKPSLAEAEALSGLPGKSVKQLEKMAAWFHREGVQRLFVTMAARGVFYSTSERQGVEPAAASSIRNSDGAGDAFMAGLAYSWLKQLPIGETVAVALAAAATAVGDQRTNASMSLAAISGSKRIPDNHVAD